MNPNSYSWCLIRCAIVKFTINNITTFVNLLGIDTQGLFDFACVNKEKFIKLFHFLRISNTLATCTSND